MLFSIGVFSTIGDWHIISLENFFALFFKYPVFSLKSFAFLEPTYTLCFSLDFCLSYFFLNFDICSLFCNSYILLTLHILPDFISLFIWSSSKIDIFHLIFSQCLTSIFVNYLVTCLSFFNGIFHTLSKERLQLTILFYILTDILIYSLAFCFVALLIF